MAVKTAIKNGSLPYCKKSKKKGRAEPDLSDIFTMYLPCQVIRYIKASSHSVPFDTDPITMNFIYGNLITFLVLNEQK